MKYPAPEENPFCQCKGNSRRAFWCRHGHVLECHYPYTCREAGCSHLENLAASERERLEASAKEALAKGKRAPYYLDSSGQIVVGQTQGHK
jgi:hypothetical protein